MQKEPYLPWTHLALLLAACALNLLPMALHQIGSDSYMHLVRIQCYAEQFWQGNWMPRWCFSGDAGLGSPVFLFYPRLPYFIASLFYPVVWAGGSVYGVFLISVAAATLLAAFGCYHWLRQMVGNHAALAAAIIYLFLPYRLEVMVGRVAYGELWVLALAPLMAHATRGILTGRGNSAPFYALYTLLALISQTAVAVCVMIGVGIYAMAGLAHRKREVGLFVAANAAAIVAALLFLLPGYHYLPFVELSAMHEKGLSWANRYVMPQRDWQEGRGKFVIGLGLSLAGLVWLGVFLRLHILRIPSLFARSEAKLWTLIGAGAVLLLFPFSAFIWYVLNALGPVAFPWRMQSVIALALAALTAYYLKWIVGTGKRMTAKGDVLILVIFLFCFELYMMSVVAPEDQAKFDRLLEARVVCCLEYRTSWTPLVPDNQTEVLARHDLGGAPRTEIVSGSTVTQVAHWSWRGMRLEVSAMQGPAVLKLYHRFFPSWRVTHSPEGVKLEPDPATGYMLLTVPEGSHTIFIMPEGYWDALWGVGAKTYRMHMARPDESEPDELESGN